MRLDIIVGTRPNFVKVTQFKKLAGAMGIDVRIIHTGQHYDKKLSQIFFEQFNLIPDHFLNVRADSAVEQLSQIMTSLNSELERTGNPDVLIVPGDVNSTLAGALVANKRGIPLAHLESGLRSFDKTMPEEINRILTDEISDFFFLTEESGRKNLLNMNKRESQIHLVGNTMIDAMLAYDEEIRTSQIQSELRLAKDFCLITMHRPSNVDNEIGLLTMIDVLKSIANRIDIVFPIHPRTLSQLRKFGLYNNLTGIDGLLLTEPLSYFDFQNLIIHSKCVITDSGGIQEESTFRGIPCMTLRENTERPITVDLGTNELIPFDIEAVESGLDKILSGKWKPGEIPPLWDGNSTQRVLEVLVQSLN